MKYFLILNLLLISGLNLNQAFAKDDMKIYGKFRYRLERIDKQDAPIRNRHRIKAVLGVKAGITENIGYNFALISGSTDPVSGNQTLDSSATSKDIQIDIAEVNYQAPMSFTIGAGKMKNPFFSPGKTELIWDGDLRPEGIKLSHGNKLDSLSYGITAAHYQLEERHSSSGGATDDTTMNGAQAFLALDIADANLKIGGSIFDYAHIVNRTPLNTNALGNSTYPTAGTYVNGYTLQEAFAVLSMDIASMPIAIFADFVKNADASADNVGKLFGFKVGKAKKANSWKFSYNWRSVEKDAVIGAFTDSDFKGGGTDGKGHEFGLKYAVTKNTSFGLAHFINETSIKDASASKDYNRTQLDFNLKF